MVAEFVEVDTGKGTDALDRRPQLAAALALAKKSRASVVVAKLRAGYASLRPSGIGGGRGYWALPQFGYAFTYVGREGADLIFRGERLGQVRWRNSGPAFYPPLFPGAESDLSEKALDAWVSRAEYRRTTGL